MANPADYSSFQQVPDQWDFHQTIPSNSDGTVNGLGVLDSDQSVFSNLNTYQFAANHSSVFQNENNYFKYYPQEAQIPYHDFDMTAIQAASMNPTEDAITTLNCNFPDCPQDTTFQTQSSLDKHIEKKHLKPYTCLVPACKHPNFGDKSGLERHKREVHSPQNYRCPITTCKRHMRGFNRAYNLHDHMKRCHPQSSRSRGILLPRPAASNYRGSEERTEEEDEVMSPRSEVSGDMLKGGGRGQGLRERWEELRKMRDDLDADMKALERTMEMMNEC